MILERFENYPECETCKEQSTYGQEAKPQEATFDQYATFDFTW